MSCCSGHQWEQRVVCYIDIILLVAAARYREFEWVYAMPKNMWQHGLQGAIPSDVISTISE